jgi:hypothetical protein
MSSEIGALVSIILGSLAALGCLVGVFWALRHKLLIDDLPTSKTQGVFIGLAELKGTAESETPLTSYLAYAACVQYAWQVDEHWSRTVTEIHTDSKGHIQTSTRTESGWTKVAGESQSIPFYLKDDTGIIQVVPEGAKIHNTKTYDETVSRDNPLYFEKAPQHEIANSTHKRRFHETALPLHTMLYVLGQARERQDVVAAEIAHDKNSPMFLISTKTEKQISAGYGRWFWVLFVLGLIFAIGGAVGRDLLADTNKGLSWQPFVISSFGFMAVLAIGWVWTVYNSLINLHHRLEQGWSQVDVQLKRRHDLIPSIVTAVAGYRAHESETQKLLTELRGQVEETPPGVAGPDFKGIAPMLRVIVESYPDLKANESFLKLQQALVDAEQRIALARDYFNEIAMFYNTRLEIVPDRFVAVLARLHPATLMSAADFERASVQVKLAS